MFRELVIALSIAIGFSLSSAKAGVVNITFHETLSGIQITGSGSIDLTNLVYRDSYSYSLRAIYPEKGGFAFGSNGSIDVYDFTARPIFGDGSLAGIPYGTGHSFGLAWLNNYIDPILVVPAGYQSGDTLNFTSFIANKLFEDRGITPVNVSTSFAGNTINLLFTSEVPLPAAVWMFLAGLGGLGFARKEKSPIQ